MVEEKVHCRDMGSIARVRVIRESTEWTLSHVGGAGRERRGEQRGTRPEAARRPKGVKRAGNQNGWLIEGRAAGGRAAQHLG